MRLLISLALLTALTALPNASLTPGRVNPSCTQEKVCKPGYTAGKDVRHVTLSMKKEVMSRYHLPWSRHGEVEIDHEISLELCGANDPENLWPQRWAPKPGAHEKDQVENYLHRLVCKGALSLKDAQEIIRTDWLGCYHSMLKKQVCSQK